MNALAINYIPGTIAKITPIACRIKIQVIYNAIVTDNIRNSSFLIQEVYDFDTVENIIGNIESLLGAKIRTAGRRNLLFEFLV